MKNFVRLNTIEEVHKMLRLKKPKHPMISLLKSITDEIVNFDYGLFAYKS